NQRMINDMKSRETGVGFHINYSQDRLQTAGNDTRVRQILKPHEILQPLAKKTCVSLRFPLRSHDFFR
ncbi:hypothetical protein, partial [Duodenibacillus massiliensis]|uniref:hypothetical protein n=1 Tax=Duodenibacillus massiliensis TaxID=1852381 RepID=UPI002FD93380